MSDTPPDRKEPGDAPEGPRNPWVSWLTWAVLMLALYVLSIGPACRLMNKHYLPGEVMDFYDPLTYLPDFLHGLIQRYIDWWVR